jgi:hypothetical protein
MNNKREHEKEQQREGSKFFEACWRILEYFEPKY